jgi:serine/threonine protein phosphatase 1
MFIVFSAYPKRIVVRWSVVLLIGTEFTAPDSASWFRPPVAHEPAGWPSNLVRQLLYAVGDIHGMDDLLAEIMIMIEADADVYGLPATIIFLGDLVNRGRKTRQVIERLISGPKRADQRWIVLRGNHEQVMLDAVTRDMRFKRWLKMGGRAALESYGGTRKDETPEGARRLIDPAHLAFLSALPLTHVEGGYLFVHAGVLPGLSLDRQDAETLLTIRGRFLNQPHHLPYTVVHGHTPTNGAPLLGPGRIGVDTGAYFTGVLTAVAIGPEPSKRRFLRAETRRGLTA